MSRGFSFQPLAEAQDGKRLPTTPSGVNVRAYEPATNRLRGGSRPGLAKLVSTRARGRTLTIQGMETVTAVGINPPGGNDVQFSNSGRVVTLAVVSGGNVYVLNPGDTVWTQAATYGVALPPLDDEVVVFMTQLNQKLYFADGANWVWYDPISNGLFPWTATAGTLPADVSANAPRLICTWRGRIVLSGLIDDPQNWFMSAIGDARNFDYSPDSITPTQAIAGNNSPFGLIGDAVTALIPYSDDVMIFGGDHTIWILHGDPMEGGRLDLVSDSIGMTWGKPWCRGPDGTLFFFSNRCGVYAMMPDQSKPQRISQQIEPLLQDLDTGANTITMVWSDRWQGMHLFITPTATIGDTTHFFWEARAGAWWQDVFANKFHNPLCACVFDGNLPDDRVVLIGSRDGYVRTFSPDAENDDGADINSAVVVGPLTARELDELLAKDMQGVLGETSGQVNFAVHVGSTAEKALSNDPVVTGTWSAGRNLTTHVRRSGHAVYVKITSTNRWAMEAIRLRLAGKGKVRQRGR